MSSAPTVNPNIPQTAQPVADLGSLVTVVQALKQGVDSLGGFRGDVIGRAVTFEDLVRLGLIDETTARAPRGASDFATNTALDGAVTTLSGTLSGYSSQPHTWTAKQTYSSADGTVGVLIAGASKGVQFIPSAGGMTVKGVDNTGAGSNPLTLDGSSLTVTPAATFNGQTTFNAEARVVGGDGVQLFFVHGVTKGLRLLAGASAITLDAVDSLVSSYQPFILNGSTVFFAIAGSGVGQVNTDGGLTWGSPTGGSKGAGTLNATGLYINGTGLQTVATTAEVTSASPGGTLTSAMMGLALSFTPTRSGTVLIMASGEGTNSNANGLFNVQIYTGTGAAPAVGDPITGTSRGRIIGGKTAAASQKIPFARQVRVSGLTVGTTYWIDLGMDNGGGGGTASFTNTDLTAVEL